MFPRVIKWTFTFYFMAFSEHYMMYSKSGFVLGDFFGDSGGLSCEYPRLCC
jgi:hypothetical protein